MNCEKNLDLIDDLVEGELDGQIAARVNAHVLACRKCLEQYEILKREKEIYAHYLFDAEPPGDLWANFQSKLETETAKTPLFAEMPAKASARSPSIFGFSLWSPALAGAAALLVVFGIGSGWLKFAPNESSGEKYVAETESGNLQFPAQSNENGESKTADLPAKIKGGENNIAFRSDKLGGKSEFPETKSVFADKKADIAESLKVAPKAAFAAAGNKPARKDEANEEKQRQKLRMINLEKEIAGQIEKVEMLLRSFRNARAVDSTETFDVGYEKEQARKLLDKNVRLRRDAESYGISGAEELLNRVEPYLLDIANLKNNPAPDTVLDIRERVKNQSIIASLQIY